MNLFVVQNGGKEEVALLILGVIFLGFIFKIVDADIKIRRISASEFEQYRLFLRDGIIYISGSHSEPSMKFNSPLGDPRDLRRRENSKAFLKLKEIYQEEREFSKKMKDLLVKYTETGKVEDK